jgi:ABC-type multidrug transport system fused ATPase/permease subunit
VKALDKPFCILTAECGVQCTEAEPPSFSYYQPTRGHRQKYPCWQGLRLFFALSTLFILKNLSRKGTIMSDIPFSKKYQHDLKQLYTEREAGHITDEELSHRSDELREREATVNEPMGRVLLLQMLRDAEKEIENEVKREYQQKNQELETRDRLKQAEFALQLQKQKRAQQTEKQKLRQEQLKRKNERSNYRSEIDNYVNRLEGNAQNWQNWYTRLQIILLCFSAITAGIAAIDGVPRWVVAITGIIATIAGGLLTTFKIQDRIYASRKAVAEVMLESQKYDYRIEEYKDLDTEGAFIRFSRSIMRYKGSKCYKK